MMIKTINCNGTDEYEFLNILSDRITNTNTQTERTVSAIIDDVKQNGDAAIKQYAEKFDGVKLEKLEVPFSEIEKAYLSADPLFLSALKKAYCNIYNYHYKQKREGYDMAVGNSSMLGQISRGLKAVGLYVPGGTASYFSTVLMNAIPANIAGVENIIMVTPTGKNGAISKNVLAAAYLCGITDIYMCGGAQAVAALSFGTESIPKVDKIVGPGNIFVATAKKQLYGIVDIDMIAGPSEILIIADENAKPSFVAADMLSQCEHDTQASAILITTSESVASETIKEIERQTEYLERRDIINKSLEDYSAVFIVKNLQEAVDISETIAPEHLELIVDNPQQWLPKITNAGSVFMGSFSPEPLGDYFAGTNHVLPTSGTARFFSPLSVDDFTKKMSYTYYSESDLLLAADDIMLMANSEGLSAHANSIMQRCKNGIL